MDHNEATELERALVGKKVYVVRVNTGIVGGGIDLFLEDGTVVEFYPSAEGSSGIGIKIRQGDDTPTEELPYIITGPPW